MLLSNILLVLLIKSDIILIFNYLSENSKVLLWFEEKKIECVKASKVVNTINIEK